MTPYSGHLPLQARATLLYNNVVNGRSGHRPRSQSREEVSMFQYACAQMRSMIEPLTTVWRQSDGKTGWDLGVGMFVNPEGWFVTAAHIMQQLGDLEKKVKSNRGITQAGFAFGLNDYHGRKWTVHTRTPSDLAIGRIEGIAPLAGHTFPKFRSDRVDQGELLCRMGYPFVSASTPTWSPDKGFRMQNLLPAPTFVNEALVSRFVTVEGDNAHDLDIWIETSSPGLKGQSGGPLADIHGRICGMQVNTQPYALRFGLGGVLYAGRAVASETIIKELRKHKIEHYTI